MSNRRKVGALGALALMFGLSLTGGSAFADESVETPEVTSAVESIEVTAPVQGEVITPEVQEPAQPDPAPPIADTPVVEPEPAPVVAPEPVVEDVVQPEVAAPVSEEVPITPVVETPASEPVVASEESVTVTNPEAAAVSIAEQPLDEPAVCEVYVNLPGEPWQVGNTVYVPSGATDAGFLWSDKTGGDLAPGTVSTITIDYPVQVVVARVMSFPIRYCFEDGSTADKEWTFHYDPDYALIDVIPTGPKQEGNVISDPGTPGLIYTDWDGNVLTSETVQPGETLCFYAEATEGYRIPDELSYIDGWCFPYGEQPSTPPTIVTPIEPRRLGDAVVLLPQPDQYYTISNELVTGVIPLTPDYNEEKPLLICTNLVDPEKSSFAKGYETCWSYYVPVVVDPTNPPVDPPAPKPDPEPVVDPTPIATPVANLTPTLPPSKVEVRVVVQDHSKQDKHSDASSKNDNLAETGFAGATPFALVAALMVASGGLILTARRRSTQL